jgi:predicted RNA-binding protein YlxR (DUF448 family)
VSVEQAKKKSKGPRPRRLPQRTCVGCGEVVSKREMIRVVRTPEGRIEADPTGKRAGRGAYLHPRAECWETGLKKGRLERSLKAALSAEDARALREYAARLGLEPAGEAVVRS